MKRFLLLLSSVSLVATSALAATPVTINNAANTDSVAVTNHALNVNATVTPSGTQNVNLTQVGTTAVVTGGVNGSLGVGGLGVAGTPAGGVVSVQGVSGGVAVPVSGATSNASSGVATSATNIPSVSYNYNFNGTTWDQAKTLSGLTTSGVGLPSAGVASVFNTTLPTYTNGQYGALQMTNDGSLRSFLIGSGSNTKTGLPAASIFGFVGSTGATMGALGVSTFLYNGSLQDAQVSITGALAAGNAGTGTTAVEEGGTTFTEITTGTSTTVKGSAGILHQICVNTIVGSATIKAYNALSATGTPITITLPATITGDNPFCLKYDIYFGTGIFVVTSGATDVTVTYR